MRVLRERRAVRRPAGMRDSSLRGHLLLRDATGQIGYACHAAQAVEPARDQRRDAARVVASVLEPPQTFDQHRNDIALRGSADDSTHGYSFFFGGRQPGTETCRARATVS